MFPNSEQIIKMETDPTSGSEIAGKNKSYKLTNKHKKAGRWKFKYQLASESFPQSDSGTQMKTDPTSGSEVAGKKQKLKADKQDVQEGGAL